MPERSRPTGEQLLARLQADQRARLRSYIGAAPGVGKTYSMLEDAHAFRREGVDVAVGFVETYGRTDTEAQVRDLEIIPRRKIEYRGVVLEEMDVDAILSRRPQLCVVDELAHTNVPGSKHEKRYQDVIELLDAGIGVLTAVNIQHLETLNDAVGRVTGVRVRETVPDTFLDRADEEVNDDVTVQELQSRLRQGKVYTPEKVEQALTKFFRETNLNTLRELALRRVEFPVAVRIVDDVVEIGQPLLAHEVAEDVHVAVRHRVGGKDVVVRTDDDLLLVPHLRIGAEFAFEHADGARSAHVVGH